jgi:hypothetical protein
MPGYTKAELVKKKAPLAHYGWCRSCRLYWHRRASHAHGAAPKGAKASARRRKAKPLTEAQKHFIDFLVHEAVEHWIVQAKP